MGAAVPLHVRLWRRVDMAGPWSDACDSACWIWTGGLADTGYGSISRWHGANTYTHIVAYELLVGPIPDGLELDHLCRVRACCNPAHMEPVTHRENVLRGQSPAAVNARRTHCVHGHELTPKNTYVRRDGRRMCRPCLRRRWRELYLRKREAGLMPPYVSTAMHGPFLCPRCGRVCTKPGPYQRHLGAHEVSNG